MSNNNNSNFLLENQKTCIDKLTHQLGWYETNYPILCSSFDVQSKYFSQQISNLEQKLILENTKTAEIKSVCSATEYQLRCLETKLTDSQNIIQNLQSVISNIEIAGVGNKSIQHNSQTSWKDVGVGTDDYDVSKIFHDTTVPKEIESYTRIEPDKETIEIIDSISNLQNLNEIHANQNYEIEITGLRQQLEQWNHAGLRYEIEITGLRQQLEQWNHAGLRYEIEITGLRQQLEQWNHAGPNYEIEITGLKEQLNCLNKIKTEDIYPKLSEEIVTLNETIQRLSNRLLDVEDKYKDRSNQLNDSIIYASSLEQTCSMKERLHADFASVSVNNKNNLNKEVDTNLMNQSSQDEVSKLEYFHSGENDVLQQHQGCLTYLEIGSTEIMDKSGVLSKQVNIPFGALLNIESSNDQECDNSSSRQRIKQVLEAGIERDIEELDHRIISQNNTSSCNQ
jgi:hypothetical protein